MTTIGATGTVARWTVAPHGALVCPDGSTVDWYVAAEDRWHVPHDESTLRQRRIDGTPVVETRVRVPGGDVLHRAWVVSDRSGIAVIEVENASPRAVAVAVTGAVATVRPPGSVPVEGIDLPDDAVVLPLGHRATVRFAAAVDAVGRVVPPEAVAAAPPALAVSRGWTATTDRASRLVLPDAAVADAVTEARCGLLLDGPVDADTDPAGFLLDVGEMVRCGEPAEPWLVECVGPAERVARTGGRDAFVALAAARFVARRAGDDRAVGDVDRIVGRLAIETDRSDPPTMAALRGTWSEDPSHGRFVRAVETRLAHPGRDRCQLLRGGLPDGWHGSDFEVHGLPAGPATSVAFAVRWHGARPALLWEQSGERRQLAAPDVGGNWSSSDESGETLWPESSPPSSTRRTLEVRADDSSSG